MYVERIVICIYNFGYTPASLYTSSLVLLTTAFAMCSPFRAW